RDPAADRPGGASVRAAAGPGSRAPRGPAARRVLAARGMSTRGRPARSDGGRAVLVGGAEDDGGAGGDAADRADLLEQVLQGGGRGPPNLKDVALVAGHAVAGLDRRQVLEPLRQVVRGGGVERLDGHEGR